MISFHGIFLAAFVATSCRAFTVSLPSKVKTTTLKMNILSDLFGSLGKKTFPAPCVMGDESIMSPKAHGTSKTPVQKNLRWDCDHETADRICNFNRHYAEYGGYWRTTPFVQEATKEYEANGEVKFYDSNTGKLLFVAPKAHLMGGHPFGTKRQCGRMCDVFPMERL